MSWPPRDNDGRDRYDAAPYEPGGPGAYGRAPQPRPLGRGRGLLLSLVLRPYQPPPIGVATVFFGLLAILDVLIGLAGLGVLTGDSNEPVRAGVALGAGVVQLVLMSVLLHLGSRVARWGLIVTGLVNVVVAFPLVVLVLPPLILVHLPVSNRWLARQRRERRNPRLADPDDSVW